MSITPVTPTSGTLPAAAVPGTSDPSASKAASAAPSASRAKPDADGDFDGSKTANDDAVKVTLSDAAVKTLAAKNGGSGA
jgi:hypothetical protein